MSTITLPNIRVSSDLTIRLKLKDGGVAIDWSTLQNIRVSLYADDQRSMASRCNVSIDEEDSTILVCQYAANKMQYLGVNRVIVQCKYMGEVKTYDKPAFNFVRWTSDQEGEQITIDDPDVDVEISVEDVSSSILQEAVDAAFSAADRANDAAEAAEHMVDIHTGPEGKSAYEVAVEEGYTGTEEEWLASLKGPVGETPDISIGTVTTVEPGTPAVASMTGTPEAPVLNLSIPKGLVGATPNFTVGTVTTGEPGSSVIVTITGTPEAPVLNLTIPQGMQGNTGSSVDYPYELVNNLTTNDPTKGLSAAQGVVLAGQVSQLEHEVDGLDINETKAFSANGYVFYFTGLNIQQGDKFKIKVTATATWGTGGAWIIYNTTYGTPGLGTIANGGEYDITAPTAITQIGVRVYNLGTSGDITLELITKSILEKSLNHTDEEIAAIKPTVISTKENVDELDASFNVVEIKPTNLLDFTKLSSGFYWTNGATPNDSYVYSDKMPVEVGKVYTYQRKNNSVREIQQMRTVVAFDSSGNIVSASSQLNVSSYTVPTGVAYVVITVLGVAENENPAFVQSSDVVSFSPYFDPYNKYILKGTHIEDGGVTNSKIADKAVNSAKISDNTIGLDKTVFSWSKNKINRNDADVMLGYIQYSATPTANPDYNLTGYIPVVAGQTYTVSNNGSSEKARFVSYFNASKTFLSYDAQAYSFTPPVGATFARLSIGTYYWAKAQMEEGLDITPYSDYKFVISAEYLPDRMPMCCLPRKTYVFNGMENSVYFKNVYNFLNDNFFIRSLGWDFRQRCARSRVSSSVLQLYLYRNDGEQAQLSLYQSQTVQGYVATNNGAMKINIIGDSMVYNGTWFDLANNLCPDLTFVGMRKSYSTGSSLRAEGRGGWTLADYMTKTKFSDSWAGFSPFLHPSGYKYYGVCEFWAAIVNGTIGSHTYEQNGFDDFASWFGADGKKLNPSENDMMYDATNDKYIYYNGSAWVDYSGVPTFVFDYGKYIETWGVSSPDMVVIHLGANDFFSSYTEELATTFNGYMDTVIASVKAYATAQNKPIKIAICTNPPIASLPNSNYNDNPIKNSRNLWNGRKNIIRTYDTDANENNGIYVVDTGAVYDTDYGFQIQEVKPFSYYDGDVRELYDYNGIHPSDAGYKQIGQCFAAFIQAVR